jgi:hypothetical protein
MRDPAPSPEGSPSDLATSPKASPPESEDSTASPKASAPESKDSAVSPEASSTEAAFAPHDITDGRKLFEWQSKWAPVAQREILKESGILCSYLVLGAGVFVFQFHPSPTTEAPLSLETFALMAWSGGLLGGTAFGLKWFYHSTAKGLWHLDRRYWRIFSPLVSSILSFFTNLVLYRDAICAADGNGLVLASKVSITSFLAGYFSDAAFAKLAELAKVLFGSTSQLDDKHKS